MNCQYAGMSEEISLNKSGRGLDKIHEWLIRNGYVLDTRQSDIDYDVWIDCVMNGGDIRYHKDNVFWSLYDFEKPRYGLEESMKGPYLVKKMNLIMSAPTLASAVLLSREQEPES